MLRHCRPRAEECRAARGQLAAAQRLSVQERRAAAARVARETARTNSVDQGQPTRAISGEDGRALCWWSRCCALLANHYCDQSEQMGDTVTDGDASRELGEEYKLQYTLLNTVLCTRCCCNM